MAEQTKGRCGRSQALGACALTLAAVGVWLLGALDTRAEEEMEPDLKKLLPSFWEHSVTVSVSGGYNDNITLSHAAPESSPFVRFGLEAAALRLPIDGTQYSFFITGEDTRYFSAGPVDHEDTAVAQAEVRRQFNDQWQGFLAAEGAYIDQVVDLSITETNRSPLLVRAGTLTARPGGRRDFEKDWWLVLEVPVTRQFYESEPDDYWQTGPSMTLAHGYGSKSEISLNYALAYRHYDTEPELDAQGGVITNTTRSFLQNDVALAWRHFWDAEQRWRTTALVAFRNNLDSGSGYFDYNRVAGSTQIRYRAGRWEFSANARVAQYWFPVQTVSGTDPSKRERTDLTFIVRAEMQLIKHLRLFAQYNHERTISNLTLDEYYVNVAHGGVAAEF
jgi:hypothetical protein